MQQPSPYAENILISLRRIIRAIDLHSRELGSRFQLTVPQLVCIRQLHSGGPVTPGKLAKQVFLSQATVTGILNRLETRGLIRRERKQADRRLVTVSLTEKGEEVVASAPLPLHDFFTDRLASLPMSQQEDIDRILGQVVKLMEAHTIQVVPYFAASSLANEEEESLAPNPIVKTTNTHK